MVPPSPDDFGDSLGRQRIVIAQCPDGSVTVDFASSDAAWWTEWIRSHAKDGLVGGPTKLGSDAVSQMVRDHLADVAAHHPCRSVGVSVSYTRGGAMATWSDSPERAINRSLVHLQETLRSFDIRSALGGKRCSPREVEAAAGSTAAFVARTIQRWSPQDQQNVINAVAKRWERQSLAVTPKVDLAGALARQLGRNVATSATPGGVSLS